MQSTSLLGSRLHPASHACIVIPTYNEAQNIGPLLDAIFALGLIGLSVIVVDDGSPDGTADIVREKADHSTVHLIEREGKLGLGSAYIAGFQKEMKKYWSSIEKSGKPARKTTKRKVAKPARSAGGKVPKKTAKKVTKKATKKTTKKTAKK